MRGGREGGGWSLNACAPRIHRQADEHAPHCISAGQRGGKRVTRERHGHRWIRSRDKEGEMRRAATRKREGEGGGGKDARHRKSVPVSRQRRKGGKNENGRKEKTRERGGSLQSRAWQDAHRHVRACVRDPALRRSGLNRTQGEERKEALGPSAARASAVICAAQTE